jgi:hypothetical protein
MRAIHDHLRDSQAYLQEPMLSELARLFQNEEHLSTLATRLLIFTRTGVPQEQPEPHFVSECTPSLIDAFAGFQPILRHWHESPDALDLSEALAVAMTQAGMINLLALLGMRMTPGSILDGRAIPPSRERLLMSANRRHSANDPLTAAARAWTKHAPRSGLEFWGLPTGTTAQKNSDAEALLVQLMEEASWWNVFVHGKHGPLYECRIAEGYGARWRADGGEFIGFVEPFEWDQ